MANANILSVNSDIVYFQKLMAKWQKKYKADKETTYYFNPALITSRGTNNKEYVLFVKSYFLDLEPDFYSEYPFLLRTGGLFLRGILNSEEINRWQEKLEKLYTINNREEADFYWAEYAIYTNHNASIQNWKFILEHNSVYRLAGYINRYLTHSITERREFCRFIWDNFVPKNDVENRQFYQRSDLCKLFLTLIEELHLTDREVRGKLNQIKKDFGDYPRIYAFMYFFPKKKLPESIGLWMLENTPPRTAFEVQILNKYLGNNLKTNILLYKNVVKDENMDSTVSEELLAKIMSDIRFKRFLKTNHLNFVTLKNAVSGPLIAKFIKELANKKQMSVS